MRVIRGVGIWVWQRSKALFSDDKKHRLLLSKTWNKDGKTATIIMINPNHADTVAMDLTTMLVINNLNALGFGAVNIVNLYSMITGRLNLRFNSDDDLIDKDTDKIITQCAEMSDAVIIAWGSAGNTSQRVRLRKAQLLEQLRPFENKLYKIGDKGYHPLTPIIRTHWELVPYDLREVYHDKDNEG